MLSSPGIADVPTGSRSVWWAHHSHRYLLPILGGVALAAGASFSLLGPVHLAVPPAGALLLLGAVTLSASLLSTALRIRLEADWAAAAAPPVPPPPPVCPGCAEPAESHHAAHEFLRQIEIWNHLRRRGSSAAFASTTGATPADFIWSSWAPAATSLPVALVGPVPETAYIPPPPGAIDYFPEHGVPMVPPPDWNTPPVGPQHFPAEHPVRPAPEPFERPGASPPVRPEIPFERRAARSGGFAGPGLPGGGGAPGLSLRGPGPSLELPEGLSPVQREALTPVPPHLRPTPAPTRTPPVRPNPPSEAAGGAPYCATCEAQIVSPAVWRRCPDCYRPICPECIVTALLEQDRGWCESCAEARIDAELRVAS